MEYRWVLQEQPSSIQQHELAKAINVRPEIAGILVQRGIHTFDEARAFFRPQLSDLHDPFLMKNMHTAVNRLCEAIHNQEKILVYGDYDVDGTTSVALVYSFLKKHNSHIDFYIPDRYEEGYGISEKGVKWAAEQGFTLMIALDCGIRATRQMTLAGELGLDCIICDHHLPGDDLPKALAVLDPKQPGCQYPFKELSGCGVGFKLLQAFCQQNTIDNNELFDLLDLLVVSIGSDIVPVVGENRVLAYHGLKKLNDNPSPGLKALIEVSKSAKQLTISDVVFYLGPRINATGRLSHAKESVRLLIDPDESMLAGHASVLDKKNTERKEYDRSITGEALKMIAEDYADDFSTVLFQKHWHKGVVGIVASRCIENFYRPTIILTESGGKATGSARSVEGFDIHEAIGECDHLLDQYGGHTHAAGLSMPVENVGKFRDAFEKVARQKLKPDQRNPQLRIDQLVDFKFVNFKAANILKQMAPFGPQNLEPVFWSKNVYFKNPPRVLKEEHFKGMLYQSGHSVGFDAIGFGLGHWAARIEPFQRFEIAYHIQENEFQGNKTLQLTLKDIKLAQ